MSQRFPVYIFRDSHFASAGDIVVTLAPIDLVVSVFGGGGLKGEGGLEDAFGGAAFFRNDDTGASYLGVLRRRKASRFRSALRRRSQTVACERLEETRFSHDNRFDPKAESWVISALCQNRTSTALTIHRVKSDGTGSNRHSEV
jgi:hypothetical protein